jgi:hypothetical protein
MKGKRKQTTAAPTAHRVVKPLAPPAATPSEAQRLAATILEVLAGVHTPTQAAEALSISLPRYYQLEARALEGLVTALAPRPKGKQPSLENRIRVLEKELAAAHRQCARQEALVRVTQRTLGVSIASAAKTKAAERDARGRKKRRPAVRALKAARALVSLAAQAEAVQAENGAVQQAAPAIGAEEVRPCPV